MSSPTGVFPDGVRAASGLLREVFKPGTLPLPSGLFNTGPQLPQTCGISAGVLVNRLFRNYCISAP